MKTLPTLYKKTNTGAIQVWIICTKGSSILTTYGQKDGKMQETADIIKEGKNLGKANATTAEDQAALEAEAKWLKQKKKGYVESLDDAANGIVDAVIEGGIPVMLAPSKIYPHFANKLTWPVICQPKIDGSRCIATPQGSDYSLWSRTRKAIKSLPHIAKAIKEQLGDAKGLILDGEAYNFQVASTEGFEGLMSLIRKDYPTPEAEQVHYYIYDVPSHGGKNKERDEYRLKLLKKVKLPLVCVPSTICHNDAEVQAAHEKNLAEGYEGTMVRCPNGLYEGGKRSYSLQKLKNFEDHEFPIIGVEEGRGKDAGTVGSFICTTKEGKVFNCRLKATYERRRELFNQPKQWKGWKLTVAHQGVSLEGIPRFSIGRALRKGSE